MKTGVPAGFIPGNLTVAVAHRLEALFEYPVCTCAPGSALPRHRMASANSCAAASYCCQCLGLMDYGQGVLQAQQEVVVVVDGHCVMVGVW